MLKWLNLLLAVTAAGSFYGYAAADGTVISPEPEPGPDALPGSYSIIVEGFDWGAGVSRAVLSLEGEVEQVSPEQFLVMEEKQSPEHSSADMFASYGALTVVRTRREVTAAYLSDEAGNRVRTASSCVTLELAAAPGVGSPMCYHPEEEHYRWADPYQLVIDLAPGQTLSSGGTEYARLAVSRTPQGEYQMPLGGLFDTGRFTEDGVAIPYASFSPEEDGRRHPLVIWLHGLGEGGLDPTVPLFGGKATVFADEAFQSEMGGAYVLIPQCPTFWLDDGTGASTAGGESCYTGALMSLIRSFAGSAPGIDPDRIYVGGCSNGGYMTLALLLEDPDFFAAAFPVCEAYRDSWLSDRDIRRLSQVPIWFVHSAQDRVCPPQQSTFPTFQRLLDAGAEQVYLSRMGTVEDQSGLEGENGGPYLYNPHYVWVPVLNNQCFLPDGRSLFQWLGEQRRPAR